jgi:hypothetical protein
MKRGLSLGARVGVAAPFGNAVSSTAGTGVSEANTSALLLPLWLDVAYRFTPRWHVNGFFQAADALSGSVCTNGCGGYDLRFGLEAEYHFAPSKNADGRVGVGAGYEILHTSTSLASTAYRGPEWFMMETGVDIRPGGRGSFRWGPFGALTFGEYDHVRQVSSGTDVSLSPSETIHAWLFLGVRGRYDL